MCLIRNTVFIAGSLMFFSCGESPEKERHQPNSKQEKAEIEVVKDAISSDFVLPSTVQVGQIFQRAGLPYVPGVTNNPDNVSNYSTKADKLLAYGVYSTDLSYCILNDQSEDAMGYMQTVKTLSDDIGLTEIYESDGLFERFEKAIGNQSDIIDIMIEVQEKTDAHIDDNELNEESAVIFAGAWIEGMYLGVKAADPNQQKEISLRLVEQMTILDNLIQGLDSVKKKSRKLDELKERFTKLEATFNNFEEVKALDNESFSDLEISIGNLKELADQIIEIRTIVVN